MYSKNKSLKNSNFEVIKAVGKSVVGRDMWMKSVKDVLVRSGWDATFYPPFIQISNGAPMTHYDPLGGTYVFWAIDGTNLIVDDDHGVVLPSPFSYYAILGTTSQGAVHTAVKSYYVSKGWKAYPFTAGGVYSGSLGPVYVSYMSPPGDFDDTDVLGIGVALQTATEAGASGKASSSGWVLKSQPDPFTGESVFIILKGDGGAFTPRPQVGCGIGDPTPTNDITTGLPLSIMERILNGSGYATFEGDEFDTIIYANPYSCIMAENRLPIASGTNTLFAGTLKLIPSLVTGVTEAAFCGIATEFGLVNHGFRFSSKMLTAQAFEYSLNGRKIRTGAAGSYNPSLITLALRNINGNIAKWESTDEDVDEDAEISEAWVAMSPDGADQSVVAQIWDGALLHNNIPNADQLPGFTWDNETWKLFTCDNATFGPDTSTLMVRTSGKSDYNTLPPPADNTKSPDLAFVEIDFQTNEGLLCLVTFNPPATMRTDADTTNYNWAWDAMYYGDVPSIYVGFFSPSNYIASLIAPPDYSQPAIGVFAADWGYDQGNVPDSDGLEPFKILYAFVVGDTGLGNIVNATNKSPASVPSPFIVNPSTGGNTPYLQLPNQAGYPVYIKGRVHKRPVVNYTEHEVVAVIDQGYFIGPPTTGPTTGAITLKGLYGWFPYSWTLGTLPTGLFSRSYAVSTLELSKTEIYGVPASAGTFEFTATFTDGISDNGHRTDISPNDIVKHIKITVSATSSTIVASSLANGTSGVAYSQAILGQGGSLPYSWIVFSGSLPPGLTLTSPDPLGVAPYDAYYVRLAGTPTTPGTYNFTLQLGATLASYTIVIS